MSSGTFKSSVRRLGLQWRLSIITIAVLGLFLSLAGLVLDRSFRTSIMTGAQEQLQLVTYALMGVVQEAEDGISFPIDLGEPRLSQPESGLYAAVSAADGILIWRSPSARTSEVTMPRGATDLLPGQWRFEVKDRPDPGKAHAYLTYAVIWEAAGESVLRFHVAADLAPFQSQINSFRRSLIIGLAIVVLLFMAVQLWAIRWGLKPVRRMAREVEQMESGRREKLGDIYPSELTGLAANLDRFIDHEKRSRSRYRNAMDDLAHSLKTPLAVIRNALADNNFDRRLLEEQVDRMDTTVGHQLSRASITGPVVVGQSVELRGLIERLLRALAKAYQHKAVDVELRAERPVEVRGDERDLMELLGNLVENAFKYTHSKVLISLTEESVVRVAIEDDGPGIPASLRERVLKRGARADTVQPGQGIGLSAALELASMYSGALRIEDSQLGGARVVVELP
ncbi:MAG: ATP-binding protein [Pseudomonadaceae bacterium]|nr:ATP-binding protein [Pseudomonadaceae bacterium]